MENEKATGLMCPLQQSDVSPIMCIAEKCMAWEQDNELQGHCEIIHGITGWLSRIDIK